jgi:hypothetical protein
MNDVRVECPGRHGDAFAAKHPQLNLLFSLPDVIDVAECDALILGKRQAAHRLKVAWAFSEDNSGDVC